MKEFYDVIFKRKSVRRFDEQLLVSDDEMAKIEQQLTKITPLIEDIRVAFRIVKKAETTAKRGQYCLLIYSENKENYLLNVGYLLEQMDLFLASLNIGVCWYGLAKAKESQYEGLDYVIMLAFGKSLPTDFRKDISKCNRKDKEIIWRGEFDADVVNAVRLAPSACNTQPWRVISDDNCIKVYQNTLIKSFIPKSKLPYFNSIDMGIFICFLEIALAHNGYQFNSVLCNEQNSDKELIEIAMYTILCSSFLFEPNGMRSISQRKAEAVQ